MSKVVDTDVRIRKALGALIFLVRWILYPINLGLVAALLLYVAQFLHDDVGFIYQAIGTWLHGGPETGIETTMVALLGFVDASMVANLIIMIVQSGHEIFIHRFDVAQGDRPQYLAHMDTGIMKVKVALSIASITLVEILKDFVNLEKIDWQLATHRMMIHCVALLSAFMMALIWRVMHPVGAATDHEDADHGDQEDHDDEEGEHVAPDLHAAAAHVDFAQLAAETKRLNEARGRLEALQAEMHDVLMAAVANEEAVRNREAVIGPANVPASDQSPAVHFTTTEDPRTGELLYHIKEESASEPTKHEGVHP